MNALSQPVLRRSRFISVPVPLASVAPSLLLALCTYLVAGCGSSGMTSTHSPPPPAPTSVTVVVSSTANDQFKNFYVDVTSISFTNQKGTVVSVLAAPQSTSPINTPFPRY